MAKLTLYLQKFGFQNLHIFTHRNFIIYYFFHLLIRWIHCMWTKLWQGMVGGGSLGKVAWTFPNMRTIWIYFSVTDTHRFQIIHMIHELLRASRWMFGFLWILNHQGSGPTINTSHVKNNCFHWLTIGRPQLPSSISPHLICWQYNMSPFVSWCAIFIFIFI